MPTHKINLIDWTDDLLGRRVHYMSMTLDQPTQPRAGVIVGPSVDRGCVAVQYFRYPKLDDGKPMVRMDDHVLLVRDAQDRAPGTDKCAILLDGVNTPLPAGGEPRGTPVTQADEPVELDNVGEEDELESEFQRHEKERLAEEARRKAELDAKSKIQLLIEWEDTKPLIDIASVVILEDGVTAEFQSFIADEWQPVVRIKWVESENEAMKGYSLRTADKSGKFTQSGDHIIGPCKTEAEIRGIISVATVFVDETTGMKSYDEARAHVTKIVAEYRSGDRVV